METYLQSANKGIIDFLGKELAALVVQTRPAPNILIAAIAFGSLKNSSCHSPHDCTEDEETDCEESVINRDLFSSSVTSSPVVPEDEKTESERNTRCCENDLLWPSFGTVGPCWETVSWWEGSGCIEDGECYGNHGENDETAAEIYSSEDELCDSYSCLYFLQEVSR